MSILIYVEGRPRPFSLVANMPGRSFKPAKLRAWQACVSQVVGQAVKAQGFELADGPYRMDLVFLFTAKKVKRLQWFTNRPDGDNLRKAIQDACNDLLPDDSRVVAGETLKLYHPTTQGVFIHVAQVGTVEAELEYLGLSLKEVT